MIHDFELDGPPSLYSRSRLARWRRACTSCKLFRLDWRPRAALPACSRRAPLGGEDPGGLQCANHSNRSSSPSRATTRSMRLPPAYVADASGRPMHSWRVLILPFMEGDDHQFQSLYDRYDFAEPWDGPHNIRLLEEHAARLRLPEPDPPCTAVTSYVAITGPGTMFPGTLRSTSRGRHGRAVRHADGRRDRTSTVPWTAPLDLDVRTMSIDINDPGVRAISSRHPGRRAQSRLGEVRFPSWTTGSAPHVLAAWSRSRAARRSISRKPCSRGELREEADVRRCGFIAGGVARPGAPGIRVASGAIGARGHPRGRRRRAPAVPALLGAGLRLRRGRTSPCARAGGRTCARRRRSPTSATSASTTSSTTRTASTARPRRASRSITGRTWIRSTTACWPTASGRSSS